MKKSRKKSIEPDTAVVYARYSAGPNQTDQSIEGQIRDCDKYAKEHGIKIIEYYCDRHISGKEDANRVEFQRMLRDSAKGQFDYVLTWKIDRFGRNREEIAINKSKLKKNGVKLLYVMESIPDGPEGIILESVLEGLAEYYSVDLAQKIDRGLRESALKGRVFGNKPVCGYTKNEQGCYSIDEGMAKIVREAFLRYSEGDTATNICKDFALRGIKTNRGKDFTPSLLYHAFRNRKYLGEYIYKGTSIPGAIPRIIDDELWEAVQNKLLLNAHSAPKFKASIPYILSGKIECAMCGENYVGEAGTGKKGAVYHYYKCHGKKQRKTKCDSQNFRKDWLEEFVLFHTKYDVLTDDMIEELADAVMDIQKQSSNSFTLDSFQAELKSVQKSIDNIMKAIEAGIITDTTKDRLLELESRRSDLKINIAREQLKKDDLTRDHVLYWFFMFRDGDIKDEKFQKKLIDVFINKIFIYKDKMVIAYNYANNDRIISFSDIPNSVRICLDKVELTETYPNPIVEKGAVYFVFTIAA